MERAGEVSREARAEMEGFREGASGKGHIQPEGRCD